MSMARLRRRIAAIVSGVDGKMGVAVQDVQSRDEIGVGADDFYPMASVCKTPILVEAYRQVESGKLSLDKRCEVTRETRTPGSGLLNFCDEGLKPTLRDLLLLMIVVSDNAATDMVLREVGGPAVVTSAMEALGIPGIRLNSTIRQLIEAIQAAIYPDVKGLDYYELEALFKDNEDLTALFRDTDRVTAAVSAATSDTDVATPRDMAHLYAQIQRNECASAESCEAIIKTLERQQLRGRLPRELPPHSRCYHKTGTLGIGTVTNDSGLLFVQERPIAIAVLSKEVRQDPAKTNTAIARIGRAIYDHFAA